MGRPDILIYGMNYAPELTGVGRYSGELGMEFAARGLKVEAITTSPHYPGWFVRPGYSARWYRREKVDGVNVLRCPLVLHKAGAGIWRLIAPLSFAATSAPAALWRILTRRPRAVLCVEPTLFAAPVALLAAKLAGARTVLHIQDLEVDAAFAVGHLAKGKWLTRLGFAFERLMLKGFDEVVTISDEMAKRIERKGVERKRLHIVRNWVDMSRIFPLGRPSSYRESLSLPEDAFVILYSGQIGAKQALHVVFEAAAQLVDHPRIVFVVAGEGPLKARFAAEYGHLPNVRLLGLQPEGALNDFLNLADCHILPQDPEVKDLVLPSKLGGMLASGKDVLVIADDGSELAQFLGQSCLRLRPNQVSVLPMMLKTLAAGFRPEADATEAARLAIARSLAVDVAIDRFSSILLGGVEVAATDEISTKDKSLLHVRSR